MDGTTPGTECMPYS